MIGRYARIVSVGFALGFLILLVIYDTGRADDLMDHYLMMQVNMNSQLEDRKAETARAFIGLGSCRLSIPEARQSCKENSNRIDILSKEMEVIKNKKDQLKLDAMKQFKGRALKTFMERWEKNELAYLAALPQE